mmetsp:Transcript_4107/g.3874  ORF Transcript_4107/g.3874 Transcript_4107/m.3874 type:complete len:267 (-) Transcript_4107:205-1005(-)
MKLLTLEPLNHFPSKLMEILSNDQFSDIIQWSPSGGNGFVIHDRKRFASEVLPSFGKEIKYASFTRRMKRWCFRLHHNHAAPKKKTSYYSHPLFIKNDAEKCLCMRPKPQRQFKKKTGSTMLSKSARTQRRSAVDKMHHMATPSPSTQQHDVLGALPLGHRILSSGANISNYMGPLNIVGQECHHPTSNVTLEPPYTNFNRILEQQVQLRPGHLYDYKYDVPIFATMPAIAGFNQPSLIQQPQHLLSQPNGHSYQLGYEPNYPYSW